MATTTQNPFPPGDDAAKTTPPAVIPTTVAPSTTPSPAIIFSNVQVTDNNVTAQYPVIGTGGVEDSYRNTTGEVTVDDIVLNEPFNEELTYVAYDANGPKDEYGDPKEFVTGKTGTTTDNTGKPIVKINETIKATADPRTGNMHVVVQLRDKNFTTKTVTVLTDNPVTPPATGTERTQELRTRTTTTTTTKKPGEGGQIVAAVEDCKDCCSAPIWLPDRTEDNWFESYWPKIEPRVFNQDGPVRAALEGVPDEPRHRARLDNAFRDGIPPDGWNVIPGASPEDQEGYNPDCWVRVDVTFDTGRGTGVESQWWCKAALRGECEDLKFRGPEIPGVPERFTDTEGYNIPEGDELFDRMHDWGQGTDNGGITKVPYPWKWEYGPDEDGNGYPDGGEWVKDPDPFPDDFDPDDDSVEWKPHRGDGSGWTRLNPDGHEEPSDWQERFPDITPGDGIPSGHPGLDPHIRNGGKRIPPGISISDMFGLGAGTQGGVNVITGVTEMETIGQTTTVRPATTQAPVPPIGDTEVDEVATGQKLSNIEIADITVNNTTIEDNVDLTVEISNADHWNFSIDDGSTVRVASYDLEHQLCTDQSDPHPELIVKDFYDYWKELKYYDAPTNNQELLGDLSLMSDESLIDLLNRQLDDKLLEEFNEDHDLLEEQLEQRFGDLDSVGDRIMEDVERIEQRLEPFQQDLREWEERARERGVEFEEFEIPRQSVDDDGNIVEEPPDIIRTIKTPEDQIPQDLRDELVPIAEAAVEPLLEMMEQLELMMEVVEETVDLMDDFVEGGENLHENEKLKKDLAKQLLDDLSKGRITGKQLAKLLSRLPSVGTGGLIDQLLYRRGYIPAPEGWLMPHPNFTPDAIPGPGVGGPHLHFPNVLSVVPPSTSICSHDAPCDSPLRTVTLTVEPGEHNVLVTAVNSNNQPLTTASSRFAVNGPSNEVSSQDQLITALRNFSNVKLTDNFEITKTIEVPAGAKITGVGNPVISTATTAFSIKESNIELSGFTITKSHRSTTGPGVIIDRPNRNSRVAPSNITIKNVTFRGLGTPDVHQTSPITILGYNKLDTTPLSDDSLSILGATNQPIRNVNIENNTFIIPFSTAIEGWEIDNLRVYNNNITNSSNNGIKVTNITNSYIGSNRLNRIASSGILLQGSRSNNIKVEGNNVSTFGFGTKTTEAFRTGIGTLNGVNGVELINNNVTNGVNSWNAGISVKQGSSNILINDNLVSNIKDGIYIGEESDSVNVKNNGITNVKRYGIQTYRSWAINIINNNVTQSAQALTAFENLSKIQQRTIGVGCGILIGSCNGVTIFSNVINGTYREQNGDSAILISGQYPISDIDQAGVEYGVYDSGSLTDIYGSPGQQVTDSLIEIIVSSNTHEGEGKLLQSNGARLILPGIDPSKDDAAGGGDSYEGDDVTLPDAATTKLPAIVTSTTPPVVRTTKPPGGIVTGPTTTTTTTQRPNGTIIVVPPTGTNTDGAIDTFIDQNTDLTNNNDLVIINTDPDDETSGFTQTETGTTPFAGGSTIIDTDPPTFVTTTTTTTTTPIPVTVDGRTREQIARDNYIDARLESRAEGLELLSRAAAGIISFDEATEEGEIITLRYDVTGKQQKYEDVRYTDGLWKENLLNWINTRNISPCSKKVSQELIKLMPQDWEDNNLYWANNIIDISGITKPGPHYDDAVGYNQNMKSVEAGGVGVRKAAVLISPSHVLMANHWIYTGGQTLTWVTNSGEEVSRTLVDDGIKIDSLDSRVFILNEPVPDTLAIYPLLSPRDDYNNILTGSLVLIGNQQRKYVTGYFLGSDPTITYDSILDQGVSRLNPAIYNGQLKLKFDAAIPFLNRWIPKKYGSLADTDRPEAVAGSEGLENGDSGSPNFILSPNGDPILISQQQYGGLGGSGAFLGGITVQEKIRGAMDSLSDKHNLPRHGLRIIDPCTGTKIGFPGIIDKEEDDDDEVIDDPIDPIILGTTPEPDDSGKVVVYSTTPPPRGTTPELPPPARAGCMDPSAENWDPRATVDDGSCVFITENLDSTVTTTPDGGMVGRQKPGCTNPNAINFDPAATFDDGSCIFPPVIIRGCTDPNALNFNRNATEDDGSCRYPIIFEPPTTQPPYIPATCREAPVKPIGDVEGEQTTTSSPVNRSTDSTDNIEDRVDIEQEANAPVAKIFPAPVNAIQVPFNSEVNFNTNITKKTPIPYGFTTIPPDSGVEPVDGGEVTTATTTICPPDNENCNTLQY